MIPVLDISAFLANEREVQQLLQSFPGDEDVWRVYDMALQGSRAATRTLRRMVEIGGVRGRGAQVALEALAGRTGARKAVA